MNICRKQCSHDKRNRDEPRNAFIPFLVVLFLISQSGCAGRSATPSTLMATATLDRVKITGWFTTIWNTEPRYFITDDQGHTTRLLLDEEVTRPFGGPLALDRKKVTVIGEASDDLAGALHVLSIEL